jgi:hypothetical protein
MAITRGTRAISFNSSAEPAGSLNLPHVAISGLIMGKKKARPNCALPSNKNRQHLSEVLPIEPLGGAEGI